MHPAPRSPTLLTSSLGWLLLAAASLVGAWRAVGFFWCSDDAFISFRYARNFNDGLGLVFNAGERVEGYTNFSWTMLTAAAMRLGADPVAFTQWAGLACFLATVALLAFAGRRWIAPGAPFVPVAAIGLALHEHAQVFASGGLETMFFTLLATATVTTAATATGSAGFLLAGGLGVLATMTRPDGILLYGVAGLVALARAARTRAAAPVVALAAPGLLVYLPYWLWRYHYYGWPFPNTFYAKSAASPYPDQGLYYAALYFACYFVLGLAPVGLLAALGRAGTRALALAAAAAIGLYVAFVVWVGGDFMFARFLVPVTPLAYLGIELLRARWSGAAFGLALTLATALGTLLRAYPEAEITRLPSGARGVVEERLNYTPENTRAMRLAGEAMRDLFAGQEVRVVIMGAQAVWAYYGEFDLVIEGCTGLTDEHLAHLPIPARSSIGHEKSVMLDPDYLLRRRVHFSLHVDPASWRPDDYRHIKFHDAAYGVIVTWDRALMRALQGRPGVAFLDFERWLDDYLAQLPALPDAKVRADYAEFRRFYFEHNHDPAREQPFLDRIR